MESDKHPDIRFELTNVTPLGGTTDSTALTLQGMLMIHGVSRTVALPGWVQLSGGQARVRSDFPLSLKEYGIKGLSKMLGVLKMYDNIEVHVEVVFGPAKSRSSAIRGSSSSYGVIRTRPSREITTVRVADPLLRRSEALESPSEKPSGEKVKDFDGPTSDTLESAGPLSAHRWAVDPRR